MSLVVMDGFDWMVNSSADKVALNGKWQYVFDVVSVGGRNGGMAASTPGNSQAGQLGSYLPVAQQHNTMIIGEYVSIGSGPGPTVTLIQTDHITLQWISPGAVRVVGPGGTLATTSTGLWPTGSSKFLELKYFSHDSTGYVIVKLNGTTVINVTGVDTKAGGSDLTTYVYINLHDGSGWSRQVVDDVYILTGGGSAPLNDFIGDCTIPAFRPDGNGASSGWMGSDGNSTNNYLLVDETPLDMADYVEASAVNTKDTYTFADLGSGEPIAVQAWAHSLRTDTVEVKELSMVCRASGGTETVATSAAVPATTATSINGVFETEPGGAAWTRAKLNAAEFGIKVVV